MSKITGAGRDHIADEKFAFPKERREPIHDAAHVRSAIARFGQIQVVTDSERAAAWKPNSYTRISIHGKSFLQGREHTTSM
jgi:hypothetical protein